MKQVADTIKDEVGAGVQVLPLRLDVSKPDEVRGLVETLPTEFKDVDVVVNIAYA